MSIIIDRVHEAAAKEILFLPHAIRQMNKPERMISEAEVWEVVTQGEVIEDYPEDVRGHSCLLAGETAEGRTIHVVCSPKNAYLAIITAYVPETGEWDKIGRKRRRKTT